MGLDIRIPMGLLFAAIGAILVVAGLVSSNEIFKSSLGINIDLWWGLGMLGFGLTMIFFGMRRKST